MCGDLLRLQGCSGHEQVRGLEEQSTVPDLTCGAVWGSSAPSATTTSAGVGMKPSVACAWGFSGLRQGQRNKRAEGGGGNEWAPLQGVPGLCRSLPTHHPKLGALGGLGLLHPGPGPWACVRHTSRTSVKGAQKGWAGRHFVLLGWEFGCP